MMGPERRPPAPTTRGRPIKVFEPAGGGCCGALLLCAIGGLLMASLVRTVGEGGFSDLHDFAAFAGIALAGTAALAGGVALGWHATHQRVLVFENGFVHRDWRGRERFVPWERIDSLEVRASSRGLRQVVVWVIPEDSSERYEELIIGDVVGTRGGMPHGSEGFIAELAQRADLVKERSRWLSSRGETWRRREDE